jgi:CD81 antigen
VRLHIARLSHPTKAKTIIHLNQFLLQLAGIVLVALAVWMLVDPTFMISLAQEQQNYQYALFILLGLGILMVFLAFCGCCGACRESQCMLVSVSFRQNEKKSLKND